MCMEDIRIGRKTHSSFSYVDIGVTVSPLIKANPKRTSLIIGVPGANPIVIGPDTSVTLTKGMVIVNNAGPCKFNIKDDGDWITRDIYAIAFVAVAVGVIEGFLPEN